MFWLTDFGSPHPEEIFAFLSCTPSAPWTPLQVAPVREFFDGPAAVAGPENFLFSAASEVVKRIRFTEPVKLCVYGRRVQVVFR
jgi:hypothetical protein